ncbi:LysR family transcriptional regulator [Pantoea ananatis]|uniref:LysR family transcriptional regulator n=1 Tax=Pantoea ananas TaxID=553 RepID=UPI000CF4DE5E|nr:LysR family transcriptional regulator [Pantoea ananatis]PQK93419.1 hypothetical protein CG433_11985 [Pantoea ananatis]
MNIKDLEYLLAVYDEGGFNKAALKLNTSQPAISMALQRLETELQATLIERTTRVIKFTEAGMLIVEQARIILGEIRSLKEIALTNDSDAQKIHIGITESLASYIYKELLVCLSSFKKMKFVFHEISKNKTLNYLDEHLLSCVISPCDRVLRNHEKIHIANEPFVLMTNKDAISKKIDFISPEYLKDKSILYINENADLDRALNKYLNNHDLKINDDIMLKTIHMIKNVIEQEGGMAILPKISACAISENKTLCIPLGPEKVGRSIQLIYKKNDPKRILYAKICELIKPVIEEVIKNPNE